MHGNDHQRGAADPVIRPRTLLAVIGASGTVISTGIAGDATVHYDCTIVGWRLVAVQTGDIEVDVWKTDYAGFPPTVTDTITASEIPSITADDKNEGVCVGWTVEVQAGDTFRFNVDSVTDIEQVTLALFLKV